MKKRGSDKRDRDSKKIKRIKTKSKTPFSLPHKKFKKLPDKREALSSYKLNVDGVNVQVNIVSTSEGKRYSIRLPALSEPTIALLDSIKQRLVGSAEINIEAISAETIEEMKKKILAKSFEIMKEYNLDEETSRMLSSMLFHEMLGLGNIEILVADPQLEEIVIVSSKEPVHVYHKTHGWLSTNIFVSNEKQIENYSSIIARRVGRQITTLTPMLDAHLFTGDRVNAVISPISTKGNTITIRKFARDPWTAIDFIQNNTCSPEIFALIWTAIQYELNILFSGGTASGKTSMLNVCMPFVPSNHRIISIEDTRELQLPEHLYWTPLVTRLPNPEGKGGIAMLDLLVNSLRMRPDRIILGEMRRQAEAEVLFEAMHTGHSVYATVHADTAAETISRLINPPINVPSNLLKAVNLCVVMFRDRRKGIRRVYQAAEFVEEESGEKESVRANILYRYEPTTDKIIKHSASLRVYEDLTRYTGLSLAELNKELLMKKQLFEYLSKNNIREMSKISSIIQQYYTNPDSIKKYL